jgi:sugar phosphate permease
MRMSRSSFHRLCIFGLCAAMFTISNFWRVSNAVIAGDLSHDLGLSPESLGLLGGAFFYSFGLVQLPMGPLLDRFGGRVVISLLACVGALSAMVFARSDTATMAILARAGIGVGMAAALMGSYKLFTTWFSPHQFATLSGILISIGNMGAMGATTPLVWLSETFGWRGACMLMATVTLLLAIAMYLVVRDRPAKQSGEQPDASPSSGDMFSGLRTVFGSGLFWRLAPLAFASYGAQIAVQGLWGGPYLVHTCGMSKAEASAILLAIPVGVICGSASWGYISDKLQRRKLPILVGQAIMLLAFSGLCLGLRLPGWALLLQCWLIGFTGSSSFVLYAHVKETFPASIVGTALTALNFFVILGAGMLQHMMGLIMNGWQPSATGAMPLAAYQWGFGSVAAVLALSIVLYITSRETGSGSNEQLNGTG